MDDEPAVTMLTERQRACLRLVGQGYVTKEIARRLQISDLRAGKDIDAAMRKLGVSRRIDAARLLAEHEERGVNVIPGASRPLPPAPPSAAFLPPSTEQVPSRMLREERSPYGTSADPPDLGWPLRQREGAGNDLNVWQRVIWITLLCAVGLIGFGTLAAGIGSLSDRIELPSSR